MPRANVKTFSRPFRTGLERPISLTLRSLLRTEILCICSRQSDLNRHKMRELESTNAELPVLSKKIAEH
jgi:hypothetical protein